MFLEIITNYGNDALIPINRIQYIYTGFSEDTYKITIKTDDGEWRECFLDEQNYLERYKILKEIIGCK